MIIASLSGIEVESCHHPDIIVALSHDHGEQSARVGLAVIRKPNLPFDVLNINENRVVQQRLLCLFTFDLMGPNLAEVVPIPFEHRQFNCICNASLLE